MKEYTRTFVLGCMTTVIFLSTTVSSKIAGFQTEAIKREQLHAYENQFYILQQFDGEALNKKISLLQELLQKVESIQIPSSLTELIRAELEKSLSRAGKVGLVRSGAGVVGSNAEKPQSVPDLITEYAKYAESLLLKADLWGQDVGAKRALTVQEKQKSALSNETLSQALSNAVPMHKLYLRVVQNDKNRDAYKKVLEELRKESASFLKDIPFTSDKIESLIGAELNWLVFDYLTDVSNEDTRTIEDSIDFEKERMLKIYHSFTPKDLDESIWKQPKTRFFELLANKEYTVSLIYFIHAYAIGQYSKAVSLNKEVQELRKHKQELEKQFLGILKSSNPSFAVPEKLESSEQVIHLFKQQVDEAQRVIAEKGDELGEEGIDHLKQQLQQLSVVLRNTMQAQDAYQHVLSYQAGPSELSSYKQEQNMLQSQGLNERSREQEDEEEEEKTSTLKKVAKTAGTAILTIATVGILNHLLADKLEQGAIGGEIGKTVHQKLNTFFGFIGQYNPLKKVPLKSLFSKKENASSSPKSQPVKGAKPQETGVDHDKVKKAAAVLKTPSKKDADNSSGDESTETTNTTQDQSNAGKVE